MVPGHAAVPVITVRTFFEDFSAKRCVTFTVNYDGLGMSTGPQCGRPCVHSTVQILAPVKVRRNDWNATGSRCGLGQGSIICQLSPTYRRDGRLVNWHPMIPRKGVIESREA